MFFILYGNLLVKSMDCAILYRDPIMLVLETNGESICLNKLTRCYWWMTKCFQGR